MKPWRIAEGVTAKMRATGEACLACNIARDAQRASKLVPPRNLIGLESKAHDADPFFSHNFIYVSFSYIRHV